jgi:hypothetical protein
VTSVWMRWDRHENGMDEMGEGEISMDEVGET